MHIHDEALDKSPRSSVADWLRGLPHKNLHSSTTRNSLGRKRKHDLTQDHCHHSLSECSETSGMSEDGNSSNASQLMRSVTNRPVLVPTPPSTKRSTTGKRSPSPTRKLLTLLSNANPPIRICQPGNAVVQPQYVSGLRRFLMKDVGVLAIPRALEVRCYNIGKLIELTNSGSPTRCRCR
jgi:hypothetical protein